MFCIMLKLSKLLGKLVPVLLATILLGTVGYLCAIGLLSLGAVALLGKEFSFKVIVIMLICALLRGVLHYAEQLCGHYMAFKVLAMLRDRIFGVMRKLAPAKLAKQKQGEWIAVLTGDIELLEVFYAHTLPPIGIAVLVSGTMIIYLGSLHPTLGCGAAAAYVCIGLLFPWKNMKKTQVNAQKYRAYFRQANSLVLENLYGMDEILRFQQGEQRKQIVEHETQAMAEAQKKNKQAEAWGIATTEAWILLFSVGFLSLVIFLTGRGLISYKSGIMASVSMFSSFGSVVALSNLSVSLANTLAAGERVLSLLQEQPETDEIETGLAPKFAGGELQGVSFAYDNIPVLKDVSFSIPKKGILGVKGKSGSGKSTLLRLLMRYWDPDKGNIFLSSSDLRKINSKHLRHMEACVMQETFLFAGSLLDNIRLSRPDATMSEVGNAAKKAGIDGFISMLPRGYETCLGELGSGISAGECQRIGLARAFLHGADLLLLDEPTSNLDALNEAILLHSLQEAAKEKSVLMVSHRLAALRIADNILEIQTYAETE